MISWRATLLCVAIVLAAFCGSVRSEDDVPNCGAKDNTTCKDCLSVDSDCWWCDGSKKCEYGRSDDVLSRCGLKNIRFQCWLNFLWVIIAGLLVLLVFAVMCICCMCDVARDCAERCARKRDRISDFRAARKAKTTRTRDPDKSALADKMRNKYGVGKKQTDYERFDEERDL